MTVFDILPTCYICITKKALAGPSLNILDNNSLMRVARVQQ